MGSLPPLSMRPCFVEKLWGGARLSTLPAKQRASHRPPQHLAIGESWEVSDLPEGQSTVDGGPYDGAALGEVVRAHGHALVGTAHAPDRFPILVKLIDAAEDLSVQVHPDAAYASAHPGAHSKDEAWLVVDVADGARILHDVVDGVDRARFQAALVQGRAHELLRVVPVQRGDVVHVPPGTMHAIGAGCVILEVQEPSDTTFRVSDFGRVDKNGRPRALHVEEALAVARFAPAGPALQVPVADADTTRLVQTRSFSMHALSTGGTTRSVTVDDRAARVLHALEGTVVLRSAHGPCEIPRGGTVVLPAGIGDVTFPATASSGRVIVMT